MDKIFILNCGLRSKEEDYTSARNPGPGGESLSSDLLAGVGGMPKVEGGVCVWIFECFTVQTNIFLSNPFFPSYTVRRFLAEHKTV